jgi:hypothetical protein
MELRPRHTGEGETKRWKITREVDNAPLYTAEITGAPPWKIKIPMEPNQSNRIQLVADPSPPEMSLPPFTVQNVSVQTLRE